MLFAALGIRTNPVYSQLGGEDCVTINPQTVTLIQGPGGWTISDGVSLILSFGSNKAEADQAISIIKHYGFTNQCFVGRPNPSMTYFLFEFPFAMIIFVITIGSVVGFGLLIRAKVNMIP